MTANELAAALCRMRKDDDWTKMTRLFGVIFADRIDNPASVVEAYLKAKADAGGGDEVWPGTPNAQEIRAGVTLAPYVSPHYHLVRKYRG